MQSLHVEGWILKWIYTKVLSRLTEDNIKMHNKKKIECTGGHGMDLSGYGYGQVARCCETLDKSLDSIKRREYLD